jgi:hypothetical protein
VLVSGSQVQSNGLVTLANGLQVLAGGMTIEGGISTAGTYSLTTGSYVNSGAISVSSPHATAAVDVLASHAAFTGTAIQGRLEAGVTATAMSLLEGTTTLFKVTFCCKKVMFLFRVCSCAG